MIHRPTPPSNITPPLKASPPAREIKIGLWGGPNSGKTTYLSALKMSALLEPAGNWRITGLEKEYQGSATFLAANTGMLRRGEFPPATTSPSEYKFEISGTVSPALLAGLPETLRKLAGVERQVDFSLYVRDQPGGHFSQVVDIQDVMWKYLAECAGLIYLYDAGSRDDAYDYVNLASDFLWQLTEARHRVQNKLPHFLAICVSKFDSPEVFGRLQEAGLVQQDLKDPRHTPYVTDPKKAFELLVDPLVMRTVQSLFHPQRIQYFFSSAIGFYAPLNSPISLEDYGNICYLPGGSKIRSGRGTFPVNVFTPLIWMESQISALARNQPATR